MFILLSPRDSSTNSIREVLKLRQLDPTELEVLIKDRVEPLTTSIDVLHLLEYAVQHSPEYYKEVYGKLATKYPTLLEEAINVAKVLSKIDDDPEGCLCEIIIKSIHENVSNEENPQVNSRPRETP